MTTSPEGTGRKPEIGDSAWQAIMRLKMGLGRVCGLQAKAGNEKAKAVIDAYKMYYARQEQASEALFACAFEEWEKTLPRPGDPHDSYCRGTGAEGR